MLYAISHQFIDYNKVLCGLPSFVKKDCILHTIRNIRIVSARIRTDDEKNAIYMFCFSYIDPKSKCIIMHRLFLALICSNSLFTFVCGQPNILTLIITFTVNTIAFFTRKTAIYVPQNDSKFQ